MEIDAAPNAARTTKRNPHRLRVGPFIVMEWHSWTVDGSGTPCWYPRCVGTNHRREDLPEHDPHVMCQAVVGERDRRAPTGKHLAVELC